MTRRPMTMAVRDHNDGVFKRRRDEHHVKVLHEFTETNKENRFQILAGHRAKHNHRQRFLHGIVTGDEK
ncbi:hypothetical protein NECAME_17485 [Necator americanus]|uniref:Uncharacterized protein n=1 Tax=Necator americanus TaxID=51031 RepID=W2TQQ6_NECAM|nr:hypothetical protein NECAME_17485 [Necator americanus]ETN83352.1 hypothetical protein NECAME_17485 [Necator americanus]